jgi:hypothetical protein
MLTREKLKQLGWGAIIFFSVKGCITLFFGARIIQWFWPAPSE